MRRRKRIYINDPAINDAAERPMAMIQVWISTGLPRIGSRSIIRIYVIGFNLRSSVPNLTCSGYQMIGVKKNRKLNEHLNQRRDIAIPYADDGNDHRRT